MDHPDSEARSEDVRVGLSAQAIRAAIVDHLFYQQARFPEVATRNDWYLALAFAVRDRLLRSWLATARTYRERQSRTVSYLSAEFLLGPHLGNNLLELGIEAQTREALAGLGLDLDQLLEQEEEPGLGNGGLGRLAACFMESLATLDIPAIGYGIRYEFGIFDQELRDGWQVEASDTWLRLGNPWEIARPEIAYEVGLGGHTEAWTDGTGRYRVRWVPDRVVRGIGYDTPILGYRTSTASLLRLWRAGAREELDLRRFDSGDYTAAVHDKTRSETLTKVLYPNDGTPAGRELRLSQQFFFVSCSLQDMIRLCLQRAPDLTRFHEKYAIQLNDTHPSIAVAELMRLLLDEHGFGWDEAWAITTRTFSYTNHTLLPEALETWPLPLFARLLPRHTEIVFEINRRLLDEVRARFPGDDARLARMSLIDEQGEKRVRMANLACAGSHAVNGVAELHTELLRRSLLGDWELLRPGFVKNVTNGVTPRRFVGVANPKLTKLIAERVGDDWLRDADALRGLERWSADAATQDAWRAVKRENKARLADHLAERVGARVDPDSLFDVQVKRIHEYKRQHLNLLHVVALAQRIRHRPAADYAPRTVILAGKAASGYRMAKLIIKLATSIAETLARDPIVSRVLRVVFVPDFNVKNAQRIYPAADLSEQISTAGYEASGTGNMKMSLNGALTIGTLDGANVEILEAVGREHFFLFGLTADEVHRPHHPREIVAADPELRAVLDLIASGAFSPKERDLFAPLVANLLDHDPYRVLADFRAYVDVQDRASRAYLDARGWARSSILNVARVGRFSSDRSIKDYAREIWGISPVAI